MTRREKNAAAVDAAIMKMTARRERAVADLVLAESRLVELRRQARRYAKVPTPKEAPAPAPASVAAAPDDIGIPAFLARGQAAQSAADKAIADALRQDIADTKRTKALVRIEHMKAKKAGELKRMPLTGRAAHAAIRS